MKKFILSFLLCPYLLLAQESHSSMDGSPQENGEYTFFKGEKTSIKNPFELRDPFKEELPKRASRKKSTMSSSTSKVKTTVDGNLYTNIPSIDTIQSIDKLKVVGVLLGKERRAMVKVGNSKDVIILKEGMSVGVDNVMLKAILPGGVVFSEKIRNVYDQDEYLETVIPVGTDQ